VESCSKCSLGKYTKGDVAQVSCKHATTHASCNWCRPMLVVQGGSCSCWLDQLTCYKWLQKFCIFLGIYYYIYRAS